jgi:hypothetical protein
MTTILKPLTLHLKGEYFDLINSGVKTFEYRAFNDFWIKRLTGKDFSHLVICRGYPKTGDPERIITRPWLGYEVQVIDHPHFGRDPIKVFAITVN